MVDILKFWRDCLAWAFWRFERREAMLTLMSPLIITIVTWLFAIVGIGGLIKGFSDPLWFIAISPFFIMVIFIAPYQHWKKQRERADKLECRAKPVLEILDIAEANIGHTGAEWSLEIRNNGTQPAKECHGNLEDIEFESPQGGGSLKRWRKNHDLQWSGEVENASSFTIAGGQKAMLILVSRDSASSDNNVTLAYRGTEQFRLQYKLPQNDPILLLINITSEGRNPQYAICLLDMKAIASDIYRGYSCQSPVTLLYHGEQRRSLGEFQKSLNSSPTLDMGGSQT